MNLDIGMLIEINVIFVVALCLVIGVCFVLLLVLFQENRHLHWRLDRSLDNQNAVMKILNKYKIENQIESYGTTQKTLQ